MDWFSGVVVYVLIWWVTIFCILPIRLKSDKEIREGQPVEDGLVAAPQFPMIKKKLIATSVLALLIWVVVYLLIDADIISFRDIAGDMIQEDYQ